jgi:hypothetical protein
LLLVLIYIFFYLTVICIPIKSHQSNKTCSITLQSVICCEYSSYLFFTFYDSQYMYMHNLCSLRTICTHYSNFNTKSKNMFMPVKHTRTMEHPKTDISHCLKPILLSIQIDYIWFPLNKNTYVLLRQIQHASSVYKVNMWGYSLFETALKPLFVNS